MHTSLQLKIKEYFWDNLKKITNSFTKLTVRNLGNGFIKCFWEISPLDNFRLKLSQSCFYAIRLFDISNKRNKKISTCIMKEIQVSKFQSSISFPIPINKGVYYIEFGYRKRNGAWRKLACKDLNLGYRIKKVLQILVQDDWFNSKNKNYDVKLNLHEEIYQLSFNTPIGGSENIPYEN